MKRFYLVIALLAVTFPTGTPVWAQGDFVPVTDAMLANPDPGEWLTWRRTPRWLGLQSSGSNQP